MLRYALLLCALWPSIAKSQSNILVTQAQAGAVIAGQYNPADYLLAQPTPGPADLALALQREISPDSLKATILRMAEFGTRNTGSDTVSASRGIGAARRWAYERFLSYSKQNNNRLEVSYLQFDLAVCGMGQHRNIMAVLPGTDAARHGIILIEGHFDSRCEVLCDLDCEADGIEDNASGSALVLEAARVLSKYAFANTIVFMLTIGEEQGLVGADAFSDYIQANNLPLRAVLNNDVIGGILCGKTASPPACPGLDNVDSTSVRLFSSGGFNSKHKQLARFIKLEYRENVLPVARVPMQVRIMSPEDRTGRGGDHIPFREKNYAAMRFTSANEHGDAGITPTYTDRQHSSRDVLGVDRNQDGAVDSFFVDFNYLARNTLINAYAAAMAARGVPTPVDFSAQRTPAGALNVQISIPTPPPGGYRIALRSTTNDWDTVYTVQTNPATVPCKPTGILYVSVAAIDAEGVESLFSGEKLIAVTATEQPGDADNNREPNIQLLQNRPNPFDEATWIGFTVQKVPAYRKALIQVADAKGVVVSKLPVQIQEGLNEVLYTHGYGVSGVFSYALIIDGRVADRRQMVFAN